MFPMCSPQTIVLKVKNVFSDDGGAVSLGLCSLPAVQLLLKNV